MEEKKTIAQKLGFTRTEEDRILDAVNKTLKKASKMKETKASDAIEKLSKLEKLDKKSVLAGFYLSQAISMFNGGLNILIAVDHTKEKTEAELSKVLISEIEAIINAIPNTKSERPIAG